MGEQSNAVACGALNRSSALCECVCGGESRGLYYRVAQRLLRRLYAVKARHPFLTLLPFPFLPILPSALPFLFYLSGPPPVPCDLMEEALQSLPCDSPAPNQNLFSGKINFFFSLSFFFFLDVRAMIAYDLSQKLVMNTIIYLGDLRQMVINNSALWVLKEEIKRRKRPKK